MVEPKPLEFAARLNGEDLLGMIRHAVGADQGKFGKRNSYCAEVGSHESQCWWTLVGLRLATPGPAINDGRDIYFALTTAGLELAKATVEGT